MKRILYIQEGSQPLGLAEACLSLTPKISYSPTGELLLDVEGTQKLLGGEKGVLSRLENIAEHFQIEKTVVTDRPEWAKPLGIEPYVVVPPGQSQTRLFSLKIERIPLLGELVIEEDEWKERHRLVAFMRRVGLGHIHDFAKLPPLAINRRFGKMGILLHQWSWGRRELPIPIFSLEEPLTDTLDASDTISIDALILGLTPILYRLCSRLEGRRLHAVKLTLDFRLDNGQRFSETLKLSDPTHDPQVLIRLLDEFLRRLTWDAPLISVALSIPETAHAVAAQLSLFDTLENKAHDIGRFLNRMKAKFAAPLGTPVLTESYVPEKGWRLAWPPENSHGSPNGNSHINSHRNSYGAPENAAPFADRPYFIFSAPRPIPPPQGRITPCEKIETQWWDVGLIQRAYYIVETSREKRWVYITPQGQWFWHGIF
ncbi:MAG: hypothetical protein HYZ71_15980 [Deltaproteobacteria bacterium]|nr:hypothetical protein [Deltaproteobacteria bacterium]